MNKLKWETSGEDDRNYFVTGSDGIKAILVYKVDRRSDRKLNKETRKYGIVTTPEKWIVQLNIQTVLRFKPFNTKKEALEFAEDLFIDCIEQLETSTAFLRGQIKI